MMLDLIPDDVITSHILPCLDEVATLKEQLRDSQEETRKWRKKHAGLQSWLNHGYDEVATLKARVAELEAETEDFKIRISHLLNICHQYINAL